MKPVIISSFVALVASLAAAAPLAPVPEPGLLAREPEARPVAGGGQWGGKRYAVPGGGQWGGKRYAVPGGGQWSGGVEAEAEGTTDGDEPVDKRDNLHGSGDQPIKRDAEAEAAPQGEGTFCWFC